MTLDNANRQVAVLGTGALGGLYGGMLAKSGVPVHFLLRSDYDHVVRHGLRVDSHWGDFHLASPNVYAAVEAMPAVDLVIVAWKATANAGLPDALRAICKPTTTVLVLQNGWDVEKAAADVVGADNVLGGCCFLCSNKIGPGHIQHLDYGAIAFGEYASDKVGQASDRMHHIALLFREAGIDMRPVENLPQARWKKLAWNIPFNGLSVVLNADTKQIMQDSHACKLAEELMHEVRQSALACGADVPESHVEKMLRDTREMVPYDSSMLLDYRARRPIEVEAIFGNPLRAARQAGFHPLRIEFLYDQLCFLDRTNRARK